LISSDRRLFEKAEKMLLSMGGDSAPGSVAQVQGEDGYLFNLFNTAPDDFRDWPMVPRPGVGVPEVSLAIGLTVECGSERCFTELIGLIAALTDEQTWVLDGDDMLWDARFVDPDQIRL
jgi:hypothetical protein